MLLSLQDGPRVPNTPGGHGGNGDGLGKERWRGDNIRDPKRDRDWWRSMSMERDREVETPRRWREEERETSAVARRDRWKEGERDAPETRRVERWTDNPPVRDAAENRRLPAGERWADSTNREAGFEARRDSKWSNRWGPEEKDRRDKWSEPDKDLDGHRERHGPPPNVSRDSDQEAAVRDRAWRPHSFANRGRGEAPPLGTTPPKFAPGFGIGRGRGDGNSVGFAAGRGRANFNATGLLHGPPSSGTGPVSVDKWDGTPIKITTVQEGVYRYPRAKLLDIYRKAHVHPSFSKYPEGFIEVPHLVQAEPLEPLAFVAPDPEEEVRIAAVSTV